MKRCPCCNSKVGYLAVILPFILGGDNQVNCKSCKSNISKKQSEYNLPRISAFPIGLILAKIPHWLGYEFGIFHDVIYFVVIFSIIIVTTYWLVPLQCKEQGN